MTWQTLGEGTLHKMQTHLNECATVQYQLCLNEQPIAINPLLGKNIRLCFLGDIVCQHCGNKTLKSYGQGYCYPCFSRLAQCDVCIMSPEKCHYNAGTCREPEWGEKFCMAEHIVYLANSSGLKVGITRATQIPTRWMDQGAIQALPIFRVQTRYQSGLIEDILRQSMPDKTNWRTLLKQDATSIDLKAIRHQILTNSYSMIASLQALHGIQAIQPIEDSDVFQFNYPVQQYPTKINSHNLDKTPIMEGHLQGIKGQYLILDQGVINIRKYTAYQVALATK